MDLLSGYGQNFVNVFPVLMSGLKITLLVTMVSVFFGIIIGLFVSLAKLSKLFFLKWPAVTYIDCVRGTPLLVQILLIHYCIPPVLTELFRYTLIIGPEEFININPVITGIIACSINSGAYVAEIFRSGIQAIDKGQMEAARSLGMSHFQSMVHIILPQAFRQVIPPLGNEFIVLLKDSSLLGIIGVHELMQEGKLFASSQYTYFQTYTAVALIYLVMTLSIARIVALMERKLNNDRS